VGARAGEGNGHGRGEEDGGAQGNGHVGPHQRLSKTEKSGEEADDRERDSTSTDNQEDDSGEIEGSWQGLRPVPWDDPEDGELNSGEEETEKDEAVWI
jgi:hypothetical protein